MIPITLFILGLVSAIGFAIRWVYRRTRPIPSDWLLDDYIHYDSGFEDYEHLFAMTIGKNIVVIKKHDQYKELRYHLNMTNSSLDRRKNQAKNDSLKEKYEHLRQQGLIYKQLKDENS